jgi:hypothetical protein
MQLLATGGGYWRQRVACASSFGDSRRPQTPLVTVRARQTPLGLHAVAAEPARQLDVLGLDGDALSVDGTNFFFF